MGVENIKVTRLSRDNINYYITYTICLKNGVNVCNQEAIYDISKRFITSFKRLQGVRPEKILRLLTKYIEKDWA